ncbi:hypothetical protein K431DRAFT_290505 [Polychaeton citri CBS 116435]|uniref:Uncharacterized protein n=1 Tax=Polychaeton citri CBS 116435 TaxID=1314669 RepID=A0A9P4QJR1_9PEZI|nr:hypothetical protein K431DRAFT_290505 [Polychaeton citri CBS 116435]
MADSDTKRAEEVFLSIDKAIRAGNPPMSLNRREGIVRLYDLVDHEWRKLLSEGTVDRTRFLTVLTTDVEVRDDDAKRLNPVVAPCLSSMVAKMAWPTIWENIAVEILAIIQGLSKAASICRSSADFVHPGEPRFVTKMKLQREAKDRKEQEILRQSRLLIADTVDDDIKGIESTAGWSHQQNLAILEANESHPTNTDASQDIGIYVHEQFQQVFPDSTLTHDQVGLQRRRLANGLHLTATSYRRQMLRHTAVESQ